MVAEIISVDEFISEEWYPGFTPAYGHSPWVMEPVDTFKAEDQGRFWFLDFHFPRGLSPMGMVFLEDGYSWATQLAARNLPLPRGNGIVQRLAGTHVYASVVPVDSEWEAGLRADRFGRNLPRFLDSFPELWASRVWELETSLAHFEQYDFTDRSLDELGGYLRDARSFHRRAWEIHFEVMYPLLANYIGFRGICGQLGIDPGQISKFLQGYDTKILECDRELWTLTVAARQAGLGDVFARAEAFQLHAALLAHGGTATGWLARFEDFLTRFGWRTEGISDINLAPWIEDPTSPLGTIRTFLRKPGDHDFDAARAAAVEEREQAIDEARSRLTGDGLAAFNDGLASCQRANFAWWNDEHNHYIDLRATIPLRRACLAIASALGCDQRDDTLFLFWPELMRVLSGAQRYERYKAVVEQRREYYEHWEARRPAMPKLLGTIPEEVADPILIEIFGIHHHFLDALRAPATVTSTLNGPAEAVLRGVAASTGLARGPARVMHSAAELYSIEPGEVLVCEATSPNWTPAFAKIAACVCDSGGTLTHASIISREYRIPCVVGVGVATTVIRNGDEIEVDGTSGTVRIFRTSG
jgi:pyruvate,water dikinase